MKINEINDDNLISGQFLILENQLKTAKNGSSFLAMKVGDATGELPVKIWDADEALFLQLEVGRVIEIKQVQAKKFKDQIQLEWEGRNRELFRVVPEAEVDFVNFLPQTPGSITAYWTYLRGVIQSIGNVALKGVLEVFFSDQDFVAQFLKVPAALKRHHAYIGGLVEHTAGVTALCRAAIDYYPLLNRDLLLTGAILHDIGKVKTYKIERGFEGTDAGKLIGHLVLGVEMVEEAMNKTGLTNTDPDCTMTRNGLIHLLVSHHGIMEWGSPVEPLTIEACVLHHADNMDAQITKFLTIIRGQTANNGWAAFDQGLGRSIFLGNLPLQDCLELKLAERD